MENAVNQPIESSEPTNQAQEQLEPQPQQSAPSQEDSSSGVGADIVSRMFERDYTIDLTEESVAGLGREAADLEKEISEIEEEKKKSVAEFNERIKKKEISMRSKLQQIREGQTTECGMVKEVRNYNECTVKIYVGPSFERLVEERTMEGDEFQKDLFLRGEKTDEEKLAEFEQGTKEAVAEFKGEPLSTDQQSSGIEYSDPAADLRQVMREETNAKTKHSSVDGPTTL